MFKTALFAAAAAIATIGTATPVLAKSVVVHYDDLDLATAQGQRDFAHRVDRAAKRACDYGRESGIPSRDAVTCYREARNKAKVEMASIVEDKRLGG